jgi:hypothetical protein
MGSKRWEPNGDTRGNEEINSPEKNKKVVMLKVENTNGSNQG